MPPVAPGAAFQPFTCPHVVLTAAPLLPGEDREKRGEANCQFLKTLVKGHKRKVC